MANSNTVKRADEYTNRFDERYDELKWLYCELYNNNMEAFDWLCESLYGYYKERSTELKKLDRERIRKPDWYSKNDLLGMMMYADAFAGTLEGVREKLPYIKKCGVNYLHLMPLLDSPKGQDDGGYAVSNFRKVKPGLGTMEDLEALTSECHRQGISCCLDFVMNHTSREHEWAKAAAAGDPVARARYFFYDDWFVPNIYEETVPQVFPTTAPGNFTWVPECGQVVMTTFYPYQWDLNYANPMVFNDMVGNMLYMANRGIDVIRLDAVPYIWKQIGTNCRNLPQVHSLVRMMRIISEIVCPGVLLLGEVVMEPSKVVPYFGTVDKPECHMLYNVTTMASMWNTVATKDVGLLKRQMDQVCALPKEYVFLNYLRCHDDIGWGLDYDWLAGFGIDEVAHKKFLNDYFRGYCYDSPARGELYNDDPRLGDARLCGTTASLSGIEAGLYEENEGKVRDGVACDLMLHAYLLTQSGIPVLYSGDEIGQTNDYSYKDDPDKCADSRYIHRGDFDWSVASKAAETGSGMNTESDGLRVYAAKSIYDGLRHMEKLRAEYDVFSGEADVYSVETGNASVLGIVREHGGHTLKAFFNFSNMQQSVDAGMADDVDGYTELISGQMKGISERTIPGYGCWWIYK